MEVGFTRSRRSLEPPYVLGLPGSMGDQPCTFPPPHTHTWSPLPILTSLPLPLHTHRHLLGLLANDGELSATAAVKGTHFIRMCTLRGIPLLFLQNTPSDAQFLSETGNDGATVKSRAQMMATLACSTVPKITIVMGGGYGPSSYAMVCTLPSPPTHTDKYSLLIPRPHPAFSFFG